MGSRLPDDRYAAQRKAGFGWLRFEPDLETEYRKARRTIIAPQLAVGAICGAMAILLFVWLDRIPGAETLIATALCVGLGLYLLDRQARMEFLLKRDSGRQVLQDGRTELMNWRAFDQHLDTGWRQAQRELTSVGLMLMELDDYKRINDTCGRVFADKALQHVATVLKAAAYRPLDGAARCAGGEFAAMWYGVNGAWFAKLAEELPLRFEGLRWGDPPVDVTVSGGAVVVWPRPGVELQDAFKAADEKLKQMKREGRGKIGFVVLQPPTEQEQHAA